MIKSASVHDALSAIESAVVHALNGQDTPTCVHDDGPTDSDEDIPDDFNLDVCDTYDAFDDEDTFVPPDPSALRGKLRRDLRAVKNAGFKVGYLGHIEGCITISIATRIARLGISEDALKVWSVSPSEYLVLLIRYSRAYQNLEELLSCSGDMVNSLVGMRIGLCDSYKPALGAVLKAFQGKDVVIMEGIPKHPAFKRLFIGSQLDKLLNERLVSIVKLRMEFGLSWTGAEYLSHASQGKHLDDVDANDPEFRVSDTWATPPPPYLVSDHMADKGFALPRISFPLLSMQFTLRHFVRCTEFCPICHCKKYEDYEALRPYVCSNPLCLYQYITFGMGPSLEYEIMFQPYVVDLLVSLAYARAAAGYLQDFPTGLGLQVPSVTNHDMGSEGRIVSDITRFDSGPVSEWCEAVLDPDTMELSAMDLSRVRTGIWIEVASGRIGEGKFSWHCRVQRIGESLTHVVLSYPISCGQQLSKEDITSRFKGDMQRLKVKCNIYNKRFDDMTGTEKRSSIRKLLDTLPSIETMTQYLRENGADKKLSSWAGITQPALDLLRWIVASNRSCIIQDNSDPEHLVSGMQNYMQFRLIQGAPDKEQRFLRAVDKYAMSKKPQYPTIFAWHGSPVHNWHSILREGLHYKQVAHGRAYGDGVYMSRSFGMSLTYCGSVTPWYGEWPQSKLKVATVISLNEVVNATQQFGSTEPHYVVQQLDWIQPRYLFVGVSDTNGPQNFSAAQIVVPAPVQNAAANPQVSSVASYKQDPAFPVNGPSNCVIQIPLSAFSSKRRGLLTAATNTDEDKPSKASKKSKSGKDLKSVQSMGYLNPEEHRIPLNDDDMAEVASIMTAVEDLNILLSDIEEEVAESPRKRHDSGKTHADRATSKTDFLPGTLTEDSLPLLCPPQYATSRATTLLQKQLQATLKVQEKEQAHELGWYIDPNLIRNVYQWIVELHTFDPELPLTQDLKKAKLQSVVLELRFPADFPMDPPFVRVIRPRFLEFANGGGGHVTQGGALCMELLTNSGWSAATSIESLLLQVRLAISSTDPRPARLLHFGRDQDYGIGEAVSSYVRACMMHGWRVPKDMERISW